MKHLGIVAHSAEGAALCFRTFCQEGFRRLGPDDHPDVTWAASQAARDGRTRVGVLGTRYLVDGPVYPRALAARGIAAEVPEAGDRQIVNKVIFEELLNGVFTESSLLEYVRIIERLAARGCAAVALVCTEIPCW